MGSLINLAIGEGSSEWMERGEMEGCSEMYVRHDQCFKCRYIEPRSRAKFEKKNKDVLAGEWFGVYGGTPIYRLPRGSHNNYK